MYDLILKWIQEINNFPNNYKAAFEQAELLQTITFKKLAVKNVLNLALICRPSGWIYWADYIVSQIMTF